MQDSHSIHITMSYVNETKKVDLLLSWNTNNNSEEENNEKCEEIKKSNSKMKKKKNEVTRMVRAVQSFVYKSVFPLYIL